MSGAADTLVDFRTGRSDSVETVEGAQEVVSRVSSDLAKKKDTVKSLRRAGV